MELKSEINNLLEGQGKSKKYAMGDLPEEWEIDEGEIEEMENKE